MDAFDAYPRPERFHAHFGYGNFLEALAARRLRGARGPLSLHVHVPPGESVSDAATYLDYLKQEADMQSTLFAGMTRVAQLHLGGGATACFGNGQISELIAHLRSRFEFAPDEKGGYSIEIDLRTMDRERLFALRAQGFRSIRIGQVDALSMQNMPLVIEANPDRITLPALKPDMLALCIERLSSAGYVYIGMDHFAKPGDDLAIAQRHGHLHRNFQGYSTHAEADLVALGVAAISSVNGTYSQNENTLEGYYARLDAGRLPIARGYALDADDLLRRQVIHMLMCSFELSISSLELAYPIRFRQYFQSELARLREFEQDGLVTIEDDWISVSPRGRLLIRNICMVFERHLTRNPEKPG